MAVLISWWWHVSLISWFFMFLGVSHGCFSIWSGVTPQIFSGCLHVGDVFHWFCWYLTLSPTLHRCTKCVGLYFLSGPCNLPGWLLETSGFFCHKFVVSVLPTDSSLSSEPTWRSGHGLQWGFHTWGVEGTLERGWGCWGQISQQLSDRLPTVVLNAVNGNHICLIPWILLSASFPIFCSPHLEVLLQYSRCLQQTHTAGEARHPLTVLPFHVG